MLNLLINAKDAIEHEGTITVITREEEISDESPGLINMPPGSYVLVKVIDNGCGIPKEVINKIFDPFFTTKGKGKGNGLGLSSVYGIVKEHKGHIAVKSEVGKGTTFDVYLPVSCREEVVPKKDTILIIDDDSDVLEMIKSILESYNYATIAVDNSLTALDIFKKHSQKIHLVITDVAMPLMGGHEVAKAIKSIRQDTKIIVISGYHDQPPVEEKDEYLSKPSESASLIAAVKRLTTHSN
jgi:CheY-like chemotaxis protein